MTKRLLPRWVTAIIGICVLALILAIVSNFIPIYRQWGFICENTGSRTGYCEWIFGVKTSEWYHRSTLESFLLAKYPTELKHKWTSYEGTGYNIFGKVNLRGHGRPGPILLMSSDLLDRYVSNLNETSKLDLYHLFQSQDKDRIEIEFQKMWDQLKEDTQQTNSPYSSPAAGSKR